MSKLTPLLATGTGVAVVSVGGMYVLNGLGDSEGDIFPDLPFTDLATFKTSKGGDCAKKYFEELDYENKADATTTAIDTNDFPGSPHEGTIPRSCLVINWERSDSDTTVEDSSKKWTGNFRWLWSFVNGDKGFVMFSTTKLSGTAKQFDLDGGIYFLSKEGADGNKTWKIKKYKEVSGTDTDKKSISSSNFDTSFLQVGDKLDGVDTAKQPHWGFMSGKQELDKLCGTSDTGCPQTPIKKQQDFKEAWKWQVAKGNESEASTPDKWSKTFSTNLSNLFGTEVSSLSFSGFKGSWKKISQTSATVNKQ